MSKQFPKFRDDTRAPVPAPPPNSCDCQVHVFGDPQRYPLRQGGAYVPPSDATFAAAKRMHEALGIGRGVVVQATVHGTNHDILIDALAGQPNYRGVAIVNDSVTDRDLQRLHDAGVRGARFNFWKMLNIAPTPAEFERSIDRIRHFGWHAKVHAVGDEWIELQDVLRTVKIPVVIDHMGHPHAGDSVDAPAFRLLLDLLRNDNWWVMLSNGDRFSNTDAPFADVVPFGRMLAEAAPDRAIWCTDWPHVHYDKPTMPNDAEILELLYRYAPDPALQKKILVDNPQRLFGF
jgi:2-pyrone-4,6-dicarboxylate lactonase